VTLAKPVYGDVRTYGGRTVAGPDDELWQWFGGSRTVMAISYEAGAIAENYVLRQIDGRGQLFAAFESDLRGMLLRYFTVGALYGATPRRGVLRRHGSTVNTPETIAAGEVHAVDLRQDVAEREYVRIDIVKVPLERALPNCSPRSTRPDPLGALPRSPLTHEGRSMPVAPTREDTWLITALVDGVDLGVFDSKSGGELDSEERSTSPGGMAAEISLGGTRTIGNVTLSRYCDRLRDWPRIKWLHSRVGAGA
jgi:hypothetical protein